jgi:hypothetical protein
MNTLYDIRFRETTAWKSLCKKHFTDDEVKKLKQAILEDYYFEMMLDELPIWGYVGELESGEAGADSSEAQKDGGDAGTKYQLFTHLDFSIAWNGDRIIEACRRATFMDYTLIGWRRGTVRPTDTSSH